MNNQMIIKMTLNSWYSVVKRADTLFEKITDEEMLKEIAPHRNRGIYLIGHLSAVHDMMLPLLDLGESQFPELKATFIRTPDNPKEQPFSLAELRQFWVSVNSELQKQFDKLTPDQWFQKHTSVSAEDFANQPHRNRLNVVLSRTNHLSYHLGQLAFLKN